MARTASAAPALLRPGETCWRLCRSERLAFLIDGAAYFAAFSEALERAEQQVLIVGWDVHSGAALDPRAGTGRSGAPAQADGHSRRAGREEPGACGSERGKPAARRGTLAAARSLGASLNAVCSRRPDLHVYVLDWDFAFFFALERELLPQLRQGWRAHPRIHFRLDGEHPTGGAHHQKVVVVDDRVAFLGGLDLAACRWDTREHLARDPRRVDPRGNVYGPFHDVQAATDGEAARALGALLRERWWRATGEALAPPRPADELDPGAGGDPWPRGLQPDLTGVTVGLARTEPAWRGRPGVREIEAQILEAVARAERTIYVENQFLTSGAARDALAARLREEAGPEVVIVTPRRCPSWLEQATMGALRSVFLATLREADRHGRLRVLYPTAAGGDEVAVNVHSKVLVVDDALLRIGSSNLTNRSLRFDSECDLSLEAGPDPRLRVAIRRFRDDLLAEHLAVSRSAVACAVAASGSLAGAVDRLRRERGRTLRPLPPPEHQGLPELIPDPSVVDPDQPLELDAVLERLLPERASAPARRPALRAVVVLAALLALAAAWRWTPLSELVEPSVLAAWAAPLRASLAGAFVAVGVFVAASLLLVPVLLLILVSAAVFGPWVGFACAFAGSLASASLAYGAGRALWRDALRKWSGPRLRALGRKLSEQGVLSVAAVRLVPVAPFTVVNLVAGASEIRYRDFLVGTAVAMAPGMFAMCVFADRILYAAREPGIGSLSVAAGILLMLILAGSLVRRRLGGAAPGAHPDAARSRVDEPARASCARVGSEPLEVQASGSRADRSRAS